MTVHDKGAAINPDMLLRNPKNTKNKNGLRIKK